jgi:tetratricopeptide (TPR) repeat protein
LKDLPEDLAHIPEFLKHFAFDFLLPLVALIAAAVLGCQWLYTSYKILFPPSADENRTLALKVLREENDTVQAEKLLRRSIKQDPMYLPSYLSLAAMQLYIEESAEDGLETIEKALNLFPNDKELLKMKMDAKAIQANLGNMVQAGAFASEYLGDAGWRIIR